MLDNVPISIEELSNLRIILFQPAQQVVRHVKKNSSSSSSSSASNSDVVERVRQRREEELKNTSSCSSFVERNVVLQINNYKVDSDYLREININIFSNRIY